MRTADIRVTMGISILNNRQDMMQLSKIPYVDLNSQHLPIKEELISVFTDVIDDGQFVLGARVEEFEVKFASLIGTGFAVGVNSGTDAILLTLRALGIGEGDEVITVPNSFIATATAIVLAGATPVFVDVREDFNMDPDKIEDAITKSTKAILPVHLTGRPADMAEIGRIAKKYSLFVIEDCAQAVAAKYKGKPVGSFGTAGCFSLHPLKTLNACGDGGVITTDDKGLYEELKILRNLGLETRDECVIWSGNSRLDALQASLLSLKMDFINDWTNSRRKNAAYYRSGLDALKEVSVPDETENEFSVYHTFMIRCKDRDGLKEHLSINKIDTAVHYPIPIHLQKVAFHLGYPEGSFPIAERHAKEILSLPIYHGLTESSMDRVIECIKEFYGYVRRD